MASDEAIRFRDEDRFDVEFSDRSDERYFQQETLKKGFIMAKGNHSQKKEKKKPKKGKEEKKTEKK